MKTKLSLFTAALIGAAGIAGAATATFTFQQTTGENYADFWTVIGEDSVYGNFNNSNNPYSVWCDNFVVNGNNKGVNLTFTGDLLSQYPNHDHSQGLGFQINNGVNLLVSGSAVLQCNTQGSGRSNLTIGTNSSLIVQNGGTVINNETLSMGNNASVIVKDGSTFNNSNTQIGSTSDSTLKKFTVEGSNNTVQFRNFKFYSTTGATSENPLGGMVEWVADANGLTTITVVGGNNAFDGGFISVDFTKLVWDESWGDSKTFTLFNYTDVNFDGLQDWVLNDADDLGIVKGATDWEFTADARHLYISIDKSAIPEPSTYAMIFGALAIAFALMRRRVRK